VRKTTRVSPPTTLRNELTSVLSNVLVRAFRFRDCEGDNIVAKVRKSYKVSTRPPATLPLSPRVSKCIFPLPALNAQLTSSGVLMTIFRVCGNGDMVVVSQNEKISTRAPTYRPYFPSQYHTSPPLQPPYTNSPRPASPWGLSIAEDGVTCLSWPRLGTEWQSSDIGAST
jgi:hypothetical protein